MPHHDITMTSFGLAHEAGSSSAQLARRRWWRPGPHFGWRLAKWLGLAVATAGVVVILVWNAGAERRGIRALPAQERQTLYRRTLDDLRTVCAAPDDDLHSFCRRQANLALEFPDCDGDCQTLAARQLVRLQAPR